MARINETTLLAQYVWVGLTCHLNLKIHNSKRRAARNDLQKCLKCHLLLSDSPKTLSNAGSASLMFLEFLVNKNGHSKTASFAAWHGSFPSLHGGLLQCYCLKVGESGWIQKCSMLPLPAKERNNAKKIRDACVSETTAPLKSETTSSVSLRRITFVTPSQTQTSTGTTRKKMKRMMSGYPQKATRLICAKPICLKKQPTRLLSHPGYERFPCRIFSKNAHLFAQKNFQVMKSISCSSSWPTEDGRFVLLGCILQSPTLRMDESFTSRF